MRRFVSLITAALLLSLLFSVQVLAMESTEVGPKAILTDADNAVASTLVSISVTPPNPIINVGASQQFTATGTYSDKTMADVTSMVTWTSGNRAVASITSSGLATGVAGGRSSITAADVATKTSVSTDLTVTAAARTLVSISITPPNPIINVGTSQQFTATGTYSDKTTADVTSMVTWTSGNRAVASITSSGLATGVAAGRSSITAADVATKISGSADFSVAATAVTPFIPTTTLPTSSPGTVGTPPTTTPGNSNTPSPPRTGSQFTLTDLTVSTIKAKPGEIIKVSATVKNMGTQAGIYIVQLRIDGAVEASKNTRSMDPGTQEIVDFEFTRRTVGTYQLSVGEQAASVQVVGSGISWIKVIAAIFILLVALYLLKRLLWWGFKKG